jgi:alkylated DNA repair dioxygenase AlkB
LQAETGVVFNSVLANLYRDGRDTVGWHSDDEPELGPEPVIASLSLGGTRRFVFRHRKRQEHRLALDLSHGSLLLMRGGTQRNRKLPRQADTSEVEILAWWLRYSAGVMPPRALWGRCSL